MSIISRIASVAKLCRTLISGTVSPSNAVYLAKMTLSCSVIIAGWYTILFIAILLCAVVIDHVTFNEYAIMTLFKQFVFAHPIVGFPLVVIVFMQEGALVLAKDAVKIGRRLRLSRTPVDLFYSHLGENNIVVYLRSFASDDNDAELELRQVLTASMELCLIGRPGEMLPPLGGKRFYAGNDWQDHVSAMIQAARLVIVRIGATDGLGWEIAEVAKNCDPSKVALMLEKNIDLDPIALVDQKTLWYAIWAISGDLEVELKSHLSRAREYIEFRTTNSRYFPKNLPHMWTDSVFVGFDADWSIRFPKQVNSLRRSVRKELLLGERMSLELSDLFPICGDVLRRRAENVLAKATSRVRLKRFVLTLVLLSVGGLCVWQLSIDYDRVVEETAKPFKSVLLMSALGVLMVGAVWMMKPWQAFRRVEELRRAIRQLMQTCDDA